MALIVVLLAALYASVLRELFIDWWSDPNNSHGFLIPLLSIYFVWERRERVAALTAQPTAWGLMLLLAGLGLFFLGQMGAELFLMRLSLVAVITGLVLYILGWRHLGVLAFPIGLLIFMIPLPAIVLNAITLPLQLLAATLSAACLRLINIPVFREGNLIFLPETTLEVAEACSGIRSLVSLTALAVVFAYFTQRSTAKRTLLVLSAVPIAILANAFRIWGTGVFAYRYGAQAAEDFYHTFAGWLVFLVAFVLLLAVGGLLSRLSRAHRDQRETCR